MFTRIVFLIRFHSNRAFLESTSRYTCLSYLRCLKSIQSLDKINLHRRFIGKEIPVLALGFVWSFLGCRWPTFQSWQFVSESTGGALSGHRHNPSRRISQAITLSAWPYTSKSCEGSQRTKLLGLWPKRCFGNIHNIFRFYSLHSSSWFRVFTHYQWKSQCI